MKLRNILIAAVAMLAIVACDNKEDDLFSESAANRLSDAVAEYSDLLNSSTNGWAMEFFPSSTEMGGYAYTAKFHNGDVELRSSFGITNTESGVSVQANTPIDSKYSVESEQGIILTFDTYNPLLHVFSQPRGSSDVDGYASDYEFIFQRVSESQDSIFLKGKKYGNEMILVRLNEAPEKYVSDVLATDTAVAMVPRPKMTIDGKNYTIDISNRFFNVSIGDSTISAPFVYNNYGFRLYKPIDIDGHLYRNFVYDSESGDVHSADGTAMIPYPTKIEQFQGTKNMWLAIFNIDDDSHEMCDELWQLYKDNYKYSSYQSVTEWGIGLNSYYTAGVSSWPMCLHYSVDMMHFMQQNAAYSITIDVDENKGTVTLNPIEPNNIYTFYQKSLEPVNNYILQHSPYRVTFNEGRIATKAHFVSVADDSVWFNLQLSE